MWSTTRSGCQSLGVDRRSLGGAGRRRGEGAEQRAVSAKTDAQQP